MTHTQLMREARELIAFYDSRGKDWTMPLCWILFRDLFGWPRHILPEDYFVKRYAKRKRIG